MTNNQTIGGVKTFSADAIINGITVGRGKFNENSNTAVGLGPLEFNEGYANTGIGRAAVAANINGNGNTGVGYATLVSNISGNDNVAIGSQALDTNISGSQNIAIGQNADVSIDGISNAVALGSNAIVTASNTIQLGNTNITNVHTSGTLTAGAVIYPNTDGIANQVLQTDGNGNLNWVTPTVSGVVPIANGGTGSATQNFVDLINDQMISGDKRFTANLLVRGSCLGTFGVADSANIGFGIANYVYGDTSTMTNNTVIGNFAFTSSAGSGNTAIGSNALRQGDGGSGDENTAVGLAALTNAQAGSKNTGIGAYSIGLSTGMQNTALGYRAGSNATTGNNNTFVGNGADINTQGNGSINNATAIGNEAIVSTSNTVQIGNTNVTAVNTSAVVTASGYKIPSGTSSQYLMADGSVSTGTSTGRTVLSTAVIDYSALNNYDVSNITVLFVRPDSIWTNIYGLQGGVLGQVIHIYSVNNQTSNCCSGLSLWNFDSTNNDGIQKFIAPGNINIDHDQDTTLIFDGMYWRVTKVGM